MDKKEQHNFALIAIVAIVAIIALVVLVMRINKPSVSEGAAFETSYDTQVSDDISNYLENGIFSDRLGSAVDKWIDEVNLNTELGRMEGICSEKIGGCSGTCGTGTAKCHDTDPDDEVVDCGCK